MVNTEFYKNGKIYKIVDNTNDNIYIGSTCKLLCRRLAQHRYQYKKYLEEKKKYLTSFEILKNNDYDIVLLEVFPCKSKEELNKRERYYIENNICVNKYIPLRTQKEYYLENRDDILLKQNVAYTLNKKNILKKQKDYYLKNKDKILEKVRKYSVLNNDNIKLRRNERIFCECGTKILKYNISAHRNTKKHIDLMELKENNLNVTDVVNKV
jgi:hypothetical protein